MTTAPIIHRVTALDLSFRPSPWAFADERRDEIAAYFSQKKSEKPDLFNGRILLARHPVFSAGCVSAEYFETDFASFLAWRDFGCPDKSVFNGFGMGALRGEDGAFVLGEMGSHTANAGKVYFPAGTPDQSDLRGTTVDIPGSVAREIEEEVGLLPADYIAAEEWHCVVTPSSIAMIRLLEVPMVAEALRMRIKSNLARQISPELCAIHLVRGAGDFSTAMPVFVTAYLAARFGDPVGWLAPGVPAR